MEMVWPRGCGSGSPYTPGSRTVSATSPVSSRTSRSTASSRRSRNSTPPPGSAYCPRNGGVPRFTRTSLPRWRTIASTATRGTATTSLQARRPDPLFLGERDRLRVPRVRVAHDAEARVRRQHPLDPLLGGVRPVADDERARVRAVSDPHAATVVHGPEISARRRVEERVQDRPIRDRVAPVPHPLRLPVRGGHGARVHAVSR